MLKYRFIISVATNYCLTVGVIGAILWSPQLFGGGIVTPDALATVPPKPTVKPPKVISGIPVHITIPSSGIDLPIDEGHYDSATQSWTLSPDHAEYAAVTPLANNHAGTTFVYGHGTDAVFGKIGSNHPPLGTTATLQTDTGHVFAYTLIKVTDLKPTDTWILKDSYNGPPRLIVQTCTGAFSEWRTMFIFSYKEVN